MRGSLVRLGLLGSLGLALLPGAAFADSPAATGVPGAPTALSATRTCVVMSGSCHLALSWSSPADDGGSPVTSFTVTGDVSHLATTVAVSGDAPSAYVLDWDTLPTVGPGGTVTPSQSARDADTSYSVTAASDAGSSAPAAVTVKNVQIGDLPAPRGLLSVRAHNNGPKDDLLVLSFANVSGQSRAIRINGVKRAVLLHRTGKYIKQATVRMKDRNGARPTTYLVRAGWLRKVTVR